MQSKDIQGVRFAPSLRKPGSCSSQQLQEEVYLHKGFLCKDADDGGSTDPSPNPPALSPCSGEGCDPGQPGTLHPLPQPKPSLIPSSGKRGTAGPITLILTGCLMPQPCGNPQIPFLNWDQSGLALWKLDRISSSLNGHPPAHATSSKCHHVSCPFPPPYCF